MIVTQFLGREGLNEILSYFNLSQSVYKMIIFIFFFEFNIMNVAQIVQNWQLDFHWTTPFPLIKL